MKLTKIILSFMLLIAVGCAHGANPVVPSEKNTAVNQSNHALWGYAEMRCNIETGEVDLTPMRSSELHLNVLGPVMATSGMDITIDSLASDFLNGLFVMDISLTHPFAGQDKLSGFDVKGILITPGTLICGPWVIAGPEETQLLNRDGLTLWWNPTDFTGGGLLGYSPGSPGCQDPALLTATINPFKSYADALGPTSPLGDLILPMLDDDAGRAIFTSGTTNTRRYEIQFPVFGGPVCIFNYAIDASWAAPVPNPPSAVPDDFPLAANQPEAFKIDIIYPNNTLEYMEGGGVGGNLRVRAIVSDWQGMAAGNIQDQIGIVFVLSPTLFVEENPLEYVSESFDHAIYEADVTQWLLDLDSADPHLIFVCAEVEYGGAKYTQGGTTVGPDERVLAFQTAWVEIATVTCEADNNNQIATAELIDLGGDAFGTLCNPGGDGTDDLDYYFFTVPPIETVYGSIGLLCPYEPTQITLYNDMHVELGSSWVSNGYATLPYPETIAGGIYFIRVYTENTEQMIYYDLYNYYMLDPCSDPVSFAMEEKIDIPVMNNLYTGRRSTLVYMDHVWVTWSKGTIGDGDIFCRHSIDGGLSFASPEQVNYLGMPGSRLWPSLARDLDGNLYCAWIEYWTGVPEPWVSTSYDNGLTWENDVNIYDFETGPLQADNEPKGILLGADNFGRLHAVWMDERDGLAFHLYYSYSDDQGFTWEPAVQIDDSSTEIQIAENNFDMDVSPGGTVAVVWTDRRHLLDPPLTSMDIYFDKLDGFTPFGTDVMVNTDQVDIEQIEPGVAIANDGIIHVAWVDRRNDGLFGGTNPPNTWELYYARSVDGGSSFPLELEIPTDDGYSTSSYMQPRVEVSPWGNVYIYFNHNSTDLLLSKSCDGGNTWDWPVTAYSGIPDTYILSNISFDVGIDGQVFALHADTRNDPGPDYDHWNLWLEMSE